MLCSDSSVMSWVDLYVNSFELHVRLRYGNVAILYMYSTCTDFK